jgi:two-component system, chemotaxis family, sensor kinase CheA
MQRSCSITPEGCSLSVEDYENPRPISLVRSEEMPFESPLVRGVAPTADGEAMLVLDVERVFTFARQARAEISLRKESEGSRKPLALVVEDAPVARELLSGILRSIGLRVEEATDGREALARVRTNQPDVILTDIEMPYMNGMEMIAELRRWPTLAQVPVVVLTTVAREEDANKLRGMGVKAVLSKQRFVEAELRQIIANCVGTA